jgi:GT2 family glycosyltransferase
MTTLLNAPVPLVSVIVVAYNAREVLHACLTRVREEARDTPLELIVVDNASRDGAADMVARDFPDARLVRSPVNLGFAAGNNVGFKMARGDYVLLLNPDALPEPGAIAQSLARMAAQPRAGLGGGRLLDSDGRLQPSARRFPSLLNEFLALSGLAARYPKSRLFGRFDRTWADPERAAPVDWVPGAFTLIRRAVLEEVGMFDERFFLYYEEVDLCRRARDAGWQVWYWPDIVVDHIGGVSSRSVDSLEMSASGAQLVLWRMRSALLYYRKHHGRLMAWLVARQELLWHSVRARRAELRANLAKRDHSRSVMDLMRRAWDDTRGGRLSPERPW